MTKDLAEKTFLMSTFYMHMNRSQRVCMCICMYLCGGNKSLQHAQPTE